MPDDPQGRTSPRLRGEDGYTIIEVIVAMVLLVVGVLGMLVMVEGSLSSTSRTTAREQATNLARELVERSREVPYSRTTTAAAPAALASALPEHPTLSAGTFTVRRRSVDYTVTVAACSIDDPTDGAGVGNTTFCDNPSGSTGPGGSSGGNGLALGFSVLGLPVNLAADGTLLTTVCNAVGGQPTLAMLGGTVASLVSFTGNDAQVSLCQGGGDDDYVAYDATPDDLRRVRVKVDWKQRAQPFSLTQTTLLTTPA